MEKVTVVLYDDLHHHDTGLLIEADASHVLELDGKRVKLDLTSTNFKALEENLREYLAVGTQVSAGATLGAPRAGKSRSGVPQDPAKLVFNKALRLWAVWQARGAETRVPTGYYYKMDLRKDVRAWLDEQGMSPEEFIARAENGEYPATDGA